MSARRDDIPLGEADMAVAPPAPAPAIGPAPGPAPLTAFSLLLVGSLVVLSTAVIAPALPSIGAHFADDPRAARLVPMLLTMPALVIAAAAPFAGYLLDRFGRYRAVLVALVGFVVFGTAGAAGGSLEWLLWTRAGLGLSVAVLMAGFTSLVGDLFEQHQRAAIMGRQVSFNSIMALCMLLIGGVLTEWDWRGMFLVYLVALPVVVMFARYVPRLPVRRAAGDGAGGDGDPGRASPPVIAVVYALGTACMLFSMLTPTRAPFLIEEQHGGSATVIALAMAVFTLGVLPAAFVFSRLRAALSPGGVFALGFALMAAGLASQGVAPTLALLVAAMGLAGLGFGLVMPNLSTTLLAAAPARLRGRLSGGQVSAIFIGQFLSPVASQPVVERYGIETTFLVAAAMLGVIALACLLFALGRARASGGEAR